MAKPCIFCGCVGRMTKEHIWPRWFGKLLVKKSGASYVADSFVGEGKGPVSRSSNTERQGDLTTMKFRVVCKSCNSGWMSDLEQKAKPIILSQFGNPSPLSREEATILSKWVVMKVMVAEFAQPNTLLTPNADRKEMQASQAIPDYFSVYLATHATEEHVGYLRHSGSFSKSASGPEPPIPRECDRNTQTVTFVIGLLVFHVVAKRVANLAEEQLNPPIKLLRLWPLFSDIELEGAPSLNERELDTLCNWLNAVFNHPEVRHAGPIRR